MSFTSTVREAMGPGLPDASKVAALMVAVLLSQKGLSKLDEEGVGSVPSVV